METAMKRVTRKMVAYVAYDGTSFSSKAQCMKYEEDHPEPPSGKIGRKKRELSAVSGEIMRHKRDTFPYFGDRTFTWRCGRAHQKALEIMKGIKKEDCKDGLDYLIRLGSAAEEVRKWKNLEKAAVAELDSLRSRRNELISEIAELEKEEGDVKEP